MARLSKAQAKAHQEACALLAKDVLTFDEKWQVYETWQESATHVNNLAGAFFTPIVAIASPPFGNLKRAGKAPRYSGPSFEYHVIDIAADLARYGAFIVPAGSAPFRYSGQQNYEPRQTDGYKRFAEQTGLSLGANCGIDCSVYADDWRGVAPKVEIVTCEFEEWAAKRAAAAHGPLFAEVAA